MKTALAVCLAIAGNLCRAADTPDIVQRAAAALTSDWAADPSYACIQRDEILKGDKPSSKTFQVVMIDGSDYHVPLAVDDQPLSSAQKKLELQKFKNEIERRTRETAAARHSRIEAWKKRRDDDGEILLDFPTALTFQLVREEPMNGHVAYVLSASPKKGLVPTTRAAKVLAGMQGTAWVEKDAMHPIRVECTVVTPVPVYGSLASVLPGTRIEISMTPVSPSTWLIDEVSMKLNVAKLRWFKSTQMTRTTYTRYRPNSQVVAEVLTEANEK